MPFTFWTVKRCILFLILQIFQKPRLRFSFEEKQQLIARFPCNEPIFPHMRIEARRLETFGFGWRADKVNKPPSVFAASGLFFLGEDIWMIRSLLKVVRPTSRFNF